MQKYGILASVVQHEMIATVSHLVLEESSYHDLSWANSNSMHVLFRKENPEVNGLILRVLTKVVLLRQKVE